MTNPTSLMLDYVTTRHEEYVVGVFAKSGDLPDDDTLAEFAAQFLPSSACSPRVDRTTSWLGVVSFERTE